MTRSTIDYGIHLGVRNSSIAVLEGTEPRIILNYDSSEQTPSAVWIDRQNSLVVGQHAKERLEDDLENTASCFKHMMGKDTDFLFERSGLRMTPEELSAEVLKSLKADVFRRTGEQLKAAVLTVPAIYNKLQSEATKRAAELAGLEYCLLLGEPSAVALHYLFDINVNRFGEQGYFLVYNFGSGGFDVAVIDVREIIAHVEIYSGDDLLCSHHIDWAIVDELLIPAVIKEYPLSDFRRGNLKWIKAIAKLKYHAEKAKIELSDNEKVSIEIDPLCQDDEGNAVEFTFNITREDLDRVARPFIDRTIRICSKVLQKKELKPIDIVGVLMVGGGTQMHLVKEMLPDGLDIPLRCDENPSTVFARGAAIYAGMRVIPMKSAPSARKEEPSMKLHDLRKAYKKEKQRLEELRERAQKTDHTVALEMLYQIEVDGILINGEYTLAVADRDPAAIDNADSCLQKFIVELDKVEDTLDWAQSVHFAEQIIEIARDFASEYGDPDDASHVEAHEDKIRKAIQSSDSAVLNLAVQSLREYALGFIDRVGILNRVVYMELRNELSKMSIDDQAFKLIAKGDKVAGLDDDEELWRINRELFEILVENDPSLIPQTSFAWMIRSKLLEEQETEQMLEYQEIEKEDDGGD